MKFTIESSPSKSKNLIFSLIGVLPIKICQAKHSEHFSFEYLFSNSSEKLVSFR